MILVSENPKNARDNEMIGSLHQSAGENNPGGGYPSREKEEKSTDLT